MSRIDIRRLDRLRNAPQQVEDLRLDGHVERRRRLVGDEQFRVAGERHGDHHPLLLALRTSRGGSCRCAAPRIGDPHLVEELDGALAARFPAYRHVLMC